jgi:hypothetical protein
MRRPIALIGTTVLLFFHLIAAAPMLAQGQSLRDLLPGFPEGGSTVTVTNEGSRTLDEYAAIFFDPEEAASLLLDWGFQENVFRAYEDTQLLDSGAGRSYLQVGVTRFGTPAGASAALPYIVQNLRPVGAHREIPMPSAIGDESRQFVADVEGGLDLTLLVRSDSLLIGISTLLTDGDPTFNPVSVAEAIIARQAAPPTPMPPQQSMLPALLEMLPPDLSACLREYGEEEFDFPGLVARFQELPEAAERLAALDWEAGAYRQFTCDVPPASGLNWVDMSVHLFGDAASAVEAVPYFAHARTVGTQLTEAPAMPLGDASAAIAGPSELGTELTLYVSIGRLLLRVTGIDRNVDPRADTELVMTALVVHNTADPRATEGAPEAIVTPTPIPPLPTPTRPPLPTATAIIAPTLPPPVPAQPPPQGSCDPSYPDVCIPPVWEAGDLDCRDINERRFTVLPPDPHHFDGPYDGSNPSEPDGIGCELN